MAIQAQLIESVWITLLDRGKFGWPSCDNVAFEGRSTCATCTRYACHDGIKHTRANVRRRTRIAVEPVWSTCGAGAGVEGQGREITCKIAKFQFSVVGLQVGNE